MLKQFTTNYPKHAGMSLTGLSTKDAIAFALEYCALVAGLFFISAYLLQVWNVVFAGWSSLQVSGLVLGFVAVVDTVIFMLV
jgi:hypothetical protein